MAIELVRRGGTVSLSGVYGGAASPMPLIQMFDKQINLRMGQANVKRWIDEILPLLSGDDDPLGVDDYATHHLPLERGAARLRDLPEEGGRRVQDPAPALDGHQKPLLPACAPPRAYDRAGRMRWLDRACRLPVGIPGV